jgi:hypothetical protein
MQGSASCAIGGEQLRQADQSAADVPVVAKGGDGSDQHGFGPAPVTSLEVEPGRDDLELSLRNARFSDSPQPATGFLDVMHRVLREAGLDKYLSHPHVEERLRLALLKSRSASVPLSFDQMFERQPRLAM